MKKVFVGVVVFFILAWMAWFVSLIPIKIAELNTAEPIDANALDGFVFGAADADYWVSLEAVASPNIIFDFNDATTPDIIFGDTTTTCAITKEDLCTDIIFYGPTGETNVLFTWKSGKFDVIYDVNHCTQAAQAFLDYVLPYLNDAIVIKAKELNERNEL